MCAWPGRAGSMSFAKVHVPTEVRRVVEGKKPRISLESLVHMMGPTYLATASAAKQETRDQKAVDELERMFRLEDPRH